MAPAMTKEVLTMTLFTQCNPYKGGEIQEFHTIKIYMDPSRKL